MTNHSELRDALHTEITQAIEDAFTYVSTDLGFSDDVIEVALSALPDPVDYDGDAADYIEEVSDNLDLSGSAFHDDAEGMIRELIYTADILEYWRENEDACDEAINEVGGFSEVADGADSIQDVICTAVAYARDREWHDVIADCVHNLECVLDKWEDVSPMVWG